MRSNTHAQPRPAEPVVAADQTDADEIDTGNLQRQTQLFAARHADRLASARKQLPERGRRVLDALPYLLHINSPSLPGYVGTNTPAGINYYQPSEATATAIRVVAPTHRVADPFITSQDLDALYFMGSAGSIAQTRDSDLDI